MASSRSKEDRERYERAAQSRTKKSSTPQGVTSSPTRTRMTLDLTPQQRKLLARWSGQIGLELDRPRLGAVEVLRATIHVLANDGSAELDAEQWAAVEQVRALISDHLRSDAAGT